MHLVISMFWKELCICYCAQNMCINTPLLQSLLWLPLFIQRSCNLMWLFSRANNDTVKCDLSYSGLLFESFPFPWRYPTSIFGPWVHGRPSWYSVSLFWNRLLGSAGPIYSLTHTAAMWPLEAKPHNSAFRGTAADETQDVFVCCQQEHFSVRPLGAVRWGCVTPLPLET